MLSLSPFVSFFFFNDTATTEIYTLSLHDALPISLTCSSRGLVDQMRHAPDRLTRSEEHTSELQSHVNIVCRLLLEKKKKIGHVHVVNESNEKFDILSRPFVDL